MAEQVFDDSKFNGVRLPKNLVPRHYDLSLKPDLKKFVFDGQVSIDFESSSEKTDSVVLHAVDLVISDGQLVGQDASVSKLAKVTYCKSSDAAVLEFSPPVQSPSKVSLSFTGILNDKLKGFYKTSFKVGETTVHAATTQFEATDARRCFPCWDEPAFKATFSVTMTYDSTPLILDGKSCPIVALSNQPAIEDVEISPNTRRSVFMPSPKMSTYLLAFIVGPFECVEKSDGKRLHRVFTTPGKKEQGLYALDVSCRSLRYYEDYFKIEYPLAKMDLVAVPDFSSGAMENWGLVTYRETCLLYDPSKTSTAARQYIALVVAHELAHQWFGNLVTMEWWTHLWLNEGFANFMEFLCVANLFPEFDIWQSFITDSLTSALSLDSLHNSHPIEVPVNHPSEIDEIFDRISYQKGSSVIRMLYEFIGDEAFRQGMHTYLSKYAYGNACTENLWEALEDASKKPVCQLMSGWTSQRGYPWLSVEYSEEGGDSKLALTQSQFTSDGKLDDQERAAKWVVPILVGSSADPEGKKNKIFLLQDTKSTLTLSGLNDSWIKLNPGYTGLYRVAYPQTLMDRLTAAIDSQALPPMDRLCLQDDYFALCSAGLVPTVSLLKLLQSYQNETNYYVWVSIDQCLGRLSMLLYHIGSQKLLHPFNRKLYSEIFKKLGWAAKEGESDSDAMARSLVINRLVSSNDQGVIDECIKRYKSQQAKEDQIPADLRNAVYKAVSTHGDDQLFDSLFANYEAEELQEERNRIGRALGLASDERLPKVVQFIFSDKVRNQDKVQMLVSISVSNPQYLWNTFKDNKDVLREIFSSGHLLPALVAYSTKNFASQEKHDEIEQFFKENSFPSAKRTVQQSLETILLNSEWLKRDGASIKEFLEN